MVCSIILYGDNIWITKQYKYLIMSKKWKAIGIISLIVIVAFAVFFYIRFYFVFGEGVKTGQLNYIVYKGYVFKTYEGKVIQSGFNSKSKNSTSVVQSYEFEFSITDPAIADSLMRCGGKTVELHYKEYLGKLPWRGQQKYVVDSIIAVR